MKKFLLIFTSLILSCTLGICIENDYKNSLLKVDLQKTGQDSYNVLLHTQKPYNEPIKVIKKSDTNYYILLPETFHSITSIPALGDIKSAEAKLFSYAGQDLNNGYTKINIFTTRPLMLSTSFKTVSKDSNLIDTKKLAKLDSAFAGAQQPQKQVQKTTNNAQAQAQAHAKAQAEAKKAQELQRQKELAQKAQQEKLAAQKAEQERLAKQKAEQEKLAQEKLAKEKAEQKALAEKKAQEEKAKQEELKKQQEVLAQKAQDEAKKAEEQKQTQEQIAQKTTEEEQVPSETDITEADEIVAQAEQEIAKSAQITPEADEIEIKTTPKSIKATLRPYYYVIIDNLVLVFAFAIAFFGAIALLLAMSKKKKPVQEFIEEDPNAVFAEGLRQMANETKINEPISAPVFEENNPIEQEQKTQESFETYVPPIFEENNTEEIEEYKEPLFEDAQGDLYEVDSQLLEQNQDEEEYNQESQTPIVTSVYQDSAVDEEETFEQEAQEVEQTEEESEEEVDDSPYIAPTILSSVEIAPNRGFMVVDQAGQKALFGYIQDEVYLLHIFTQRVTNFDIKFRISDRQDEKVFFIVRVDNYKLLIRVANDSMKLELEM